MKINKMDVGGMHMGKIFRENKNEKRPFTNKFISSIFITVLLLYFMAKTQNSKLIFVPFLICSITMAGKHLALMFGKNKLAEIFSKIFAMGFFVFWFGFLIFAAYICFRDKHYSILLFSGIFWVAGILFAKKRFFKTKENRPKTGIPPYAIILTSISLIVLMLVGIGLLMQGILEKSFGITFMGGFFLFGSFTFILFAFAMKGCFDKCKIDVLGLYVGIFFVVIGSGIIAMIYQQQIGFWIAVPVLLIVAGILQIIKCLRNKK